jgi:hypothetical protein
MAMNDSLSPRNSFDSTFIFVTPAAGFKGETCFRQTLWRLDDQLIHQYAALIQRLFLIQHYGIGGGNHLNHSQPLIAVNA